MSADRPEVAFKVMDRAEWRAALAEGHYDGSAADRTDGFIHLSTETQLPGTLAKHYAGRQDLVLLTVALDRVEADLVWEPSRGGDLFPHIYGALPVSAVTLRRDLAVGPDGAMAISDGDPA